jgi:hypothetical protein
MMVRVEVEDIERDFSNPLFACIVLGGIQIGKGILELAGGDGRKSSNSECTGEGSVLQWGEGLVHIRAKLERQSKKVRGDVAGANDGLDDLGKYLHRIADLEIKSQCLDNLALKAN